MPKNSLSKGRIPINRRTPSEERKFLKILIGSAPVSPRNALRTLFRAACRSDGNGKAARYFLFWLDGETPPDGPSEEGGSELLSLSEKQKKTAFAVLKWWATPRRNIETLLRLHEKIRARFDAEISPGG
jgi:hypothetical protein